MTEFIPLARPYAQAVFEYALQQQQLELWENELGKLAKIIKTPLIAQVLQNPKYSEKQHAEILLSLIEKKDIAVPLTNFVKILAENRRLFLLPEIMHLFRELLTEQQKVLEANVVSALKLDEPYLEQLNQTLSKKLGKIIKLHTQIDPTLLGGIVVRVGDVVLDGSIRSELLRLRQELLN